MEIEILEKLLKIAKDIKADYAEVYNNNETYLSFKFTWDKKKENGN